MSFRKEIKLKIDSSKLIEFKNFLIEKQFDEQFPERLIESIYFDNQNFDMFIDSIEGTIPRKKIRIRSYNKMNRYFYEEKISSFENRFKTSKLLDDHQKLLKDGTLDKSYGICKNKLTVSYLRKYYKLNEFRVTIDRCLKFKKFSKNFRLINKYESQDIAVEVKCPAETPNEKIFKIFPFEQIRFSKYSEAIEKLKLV
tara:strand:+ start:227 stop:820 length:594 start_codon:yes stop_codon:yes gene_type:complete